METKILLPNISGKIDYVGDKVQSFGYYPTNNFYQTVSIHTINFVGRVYLYGSLKENPDKDNKLDWVMIPLTSETPYIEYDNYDAVNVKRVNDIFSIKGKWTWLKAEVDRSSYIRITDVPVAPYDYHSRYIITSGVNIEPHTASLNYKNDPTWFDSNVFKPNYSLAYTKMLASSKLGNVEKIMLCY